MSRRVLPCGLGGVIGGHQVACCPLLSGRMAPLRTCGFGVSRMGVLASGRAFVAACLSEIPGPRLGGRCALTSLG